MEQEFTVVLQSSRIMEQEFTSIPIPKKKRLIVQVYELPEDEERYCQHLQPRMREGQYTKTKLCYVQDGDFKRTVDENGIPHGEKFEVSIVVCPCCNLPVCDLRHLSEREIAAGHDRYIHHNMLLCNTCAELPLEMIEQIIAFRKSLE